MKNILYCTIYYSGLFEFFELNSNNKKLYNHLTLQDRKNIEVYYKEGLSYSAIGLRIGKDKSTICREIIRNSTSWYYFKNKTRTKYRYRANLANKKALKRVNKGNVVPNLLQFLYIMEQEIEIY